MVQLEHWKKCAQRKNVGNDMNNITVGESVSLQPFTYWKFLFRSLQVLNFMVIKEMLNTCTRLEKLLIVLGENGVTAKN